MTDALVTVSFSLFHINPITHRMAKTACGIKSHSDLDISIAIGIGFGIPLSAKVLRFMAKKNSSS